MSEISREEFERTINGLEKDLDDVKKLIGDIFDKLQALAETLNTTATSAQLLKQHVDDKNFIAQSDGDTRYVQNTQEFKDQQLQMGRLLWLGSWWFKLGLGGPLLVWLIQKALELKESV